MNCLSSKNAYNKAILLNYSHELFLNLKKFKDSYRREIQKIKFSPADFGDFPRTENEILKVLGRQSKNWIPKLASFFEEYKHLTSNYLKDPSKEVSILNISCTNKNLNSIFKNKQTISNLIKKLIEIKGLVCVDSDYIFEFSKNKNKCRAYAYNKEIEKLILKMNSNYDNIFKQRQNMSIKIDSFNDVLLIDNHSFNIDDNEIDNDYYSFDDNDYNDIEINNNNNHNIYISLGQKVALSVKKHYKIKVSSKLKVPHCTNEECSQILNDYYYDLLKSRIEKINKMNSHLPCEQRINFSWNIHRSAKDFITKIGRRATSRIASLKEHENGNKDYKGVWRRDYLKEYFEGANWFEYDVRGSIFQISHLLNKGWWLGNERDSDPYEKMFGEPFASPQERKDFKTICMPLYFDYTNSIVRHNEYRTPQTLQAYEKSEINAALHNAAESMLAFTGDKLDSEIFLHESLLYIDFVYRLREELKLDVVQIYDGFYLREGSITNESLEHIMRQCALQYKVEYDAWKSHF